MLDAMAKEAAVFEPKEVEVLTTALGLALDKCGVDRGADETQTTQMASLVHNLGRSRIKLGKGLRNAADAARLADEAADIMGYIKQMPDAKIAEYKADRAIDRDITIFPTDLRTPPTSAFRKI